MLALGGVQTLSTVTCDIVVPANWIQTGEVRVYTGSVRCIRAITRTQIIYCAMRDPQQ